MRLLCISEWAASPGVTRGNLNHYGAIHKHALSTRVERLCQRWSFSFPSPPKNIYIFFNWGIYFEHWKKYGFITTYIYKRVTIKVPRCMELMLDATYDPVFNTPTCVYPDVEELLEMMKLFHLKHQMAKTLQPFFLISGKCSLLYLNIYV